MKKNNLLIGAFAVAVMIFASSCDKNQKAVKNLAGTWTTTEVLLNDTAVDLTGTTGSTTFESCKLKSEGPCPASGTSTSSFELLGSTYSTTSTSEMTYSVDDDGTELSTTLVSSTSTTSVDGTAGDPVTSTCTGADCSSSTTIVTLDGSTLVTENTDSDGGVWRSTATK